MQIEPMQPERIRVRGEKPNPDYDTGVRLPLLDITEYTTQWGIDFGLFRFILRADGKLFINEEEYVAPYKP